MIMRVQAPGDLVVATREQLRGEILKHVEAGHDVAVDLSKAGYVDSSAIGMLLKCSRLAREAGHRIQLTGCNSDTRALFRHAQLLGRLEVA